MQTVRGETVGGVNDNLLFSEQKSRLGSVSISIIDYNAESQRTQTCLPAEVNTHREFRLGIVGTQAGLCVKNYIQIETLPKTALPRPAANRLDNMGTCA